MMKVIALQSCCLLFVGTVAFSPLGGLLPAAPLIEIAPGVQLPLVSLGTAEFDGEELCNITKLALALGYTAIDNDDGGRGTDMGICLGGVNRSTFFFDSQGQWWADESTDCGRGRGRAEGVGARADRSAAAAPPDASAGHVVGSDDRRAVGSH